MWEDAAVGELSRLEVEDVVNFFTNFCNCALYRFGMGGVRMVGSSTFEEEWIWVLFFGDVDVSFLFSSSSSSLLSLDVDVLEDDLEERVARVVNVSLNPA